MSSTWVSKTLVLIRNAFNTGVAHVIMRTSTQLPMSVALATRVDTASLRKQTEVDTGTFLAALGGLTVLVPHTFHFAASWVGLSLVEVVALTVLEA